MTYIIDINSKSGIYHVEDFSLWEKRFPEERRSICKSPLIRYTGKGIIEISDTTAKLSLNRLCKICKKILDKKAV